MGSPTKPYKEGVWLWFAPVWVCFDYKILTWAVNQFNLAAPFFNAFRWLINIIYTIIFLNFFTNILSMRLTCISLDLTYSCLKAGLISQFLNPSRAAQVSIGEPSRPFVIPRQNRLAQCHLSRVNSVESRLVESKFGFIHLCDPYYYFAIYSLKSANTPSKGSQNWHE